MERVLIVEDEKVIADQLRNVLKKEGFEVLVASDGEAAIEICVRERPGIIISDINMPKVDGMELLHTARRMDPAVQVILMTGYGDYGGVLHAIRGGALDYLKKPIDLDELFVAIGRATEKLAAVRASLAPMSVLVVEDEPEAREMIARVLRKEGYEVMVAEDGDKAVQCMKEKRPALVVSDLRLPHKDGLELMSTVRSYGWADTEFILITGYGDEQSAIQALRLGAAGFLRKPIDLEELLVILERAAERQKLRQSCLYRVRELDLAKEIVAAITSRREITIRIGQKPVEARDLAETILDALPFPMLALNGEMHVMHANRQARSVLSSGDQTVSEPTLRRFGLPVSDYTAIADSVRKVFEASAPLTVHQNVGQFSFYFLTKVFILSEAETHKAVLMVIRGERPPR